MSARAFCTVTASTKRNADLGSGRTGAAAENLTSIAITPLWPLEVGTIQVYNIARPAETKECYHVPADGDALPDVVEGDILTVDGTDYPVQHVGEWTDNGVPCLQIIVQEIKGT